MIEHATSADIATLTEVVSAHLAPNSQLLVYRLEGVPRGCLSWQVVTQPSCQTCHSDRLALLKHIFVVPNFRRHGMGRRLITRFEDEITQDRCIAWRAAVSSGTMGFAGLMACSGAVQSAVGYEKRL